MEFQQAFVIRFRVQGLVWASLAVIKSGFKKGFRMPGRERARERERDREREKERGGRALVPGGPYSRETQTERGFVLLLKRTAPAPLQVHPWPVPKAQDTPCVPCCQV